MTPSTAPARLLVVDDEPSLRMTLAANFELEGYEVREAESAEEALALVAAEPFAVVVSDVRMTGMNGLDLFRELRKIRPELPVVLITAFAVESLVREAKREGIFTVVTKPVDFTALARIVARALARPVVLIVDDSPSVAEAAVGACELVGLEVKGALGGEECLRVIEELDVDVVVVDMVMPGMNGVELVDRLRKVRPDVSVVGISGYSVPDMMQQVARLGAFTILEKPFAHEELIEVIASARGAAARR